MKKIIVLLTAVLIAGSAIANEGGKKHAEPAKAKVQTMCPVMNKPINKNLYVDYKGERIYVCCQSCVNVVKKNPDKWLKKLEAQGITPEKVKKTNRKYVAQTMCPVMNRPINKDLYVDYKGERIYVCCQGCINVVKKNPEKWLKKLEAQGITPEKVK